jgi:hypothetical protein
VGSVFNPLFEHEQNKDITVKNEKTGVKTEMTLSEDDFLVFNSYFLAGKLRWIA